MKLALTSSHASPLATALGQVEPGETGVVPLPTARFLDVKSLLDATTDLAYQIVEGAGTASWVDVPTLATGAATTQTFTVAGTDTHSTVGVSFRGALPAGCIAAAQATAANTVKVTVINASGGNVDVTATTLDLTWTNPSAL